MVLKRTDFTAYNLPSISLLQQYLPFTVLKLSRIGVDPVFVQELTLQQYLPFTVLKHKSACKMTARMAGSCNSTYRLRY